MQVIAIIVCTPGTIETTKRWCTHGFPFFSFVLLKWSQGTQWFTDFWYLLIYAFCWSLWRGVLIPYSIAATTWWLLNEIRRTLIILCACKCSAINLEHRHLYRHQEELLLGNKVIFLPIFCRKMEHLTLLHDVPFHVIDGYRNLGHMIFRTLEPQGQALHNLSPLNLHGSLSESVLAIMRHENCYPQFSTLESMLLCCSLHE